LFYIDGDIKRHLKELIQKIKYFKNISYKGLFIDFPGVLISWFLVFRR